MTASSPRGVGGLRPIALLVMFLLELAALVSLAVAGFSLSGPVQWVAGLGLPVLFAVVWGVFAAPRASRPLHGAADLTFRVVWFALAFGALALAGWWPVGVALFLLWLATHGFLATARA